MFVDVTKLQCSAEKIIALKKPLSGSKSGVYCINIWSISEKPLEKEVKVSPVWEINQIECLTGLVNNIFCFCFHKLPKVTIDSFIADSPLSYPFPTLMPCSSSETGAPVALWIEGEPPGPGLERKKTRQKKEFENCYSLRLLLNLANRIKWLKSKKNPYGSFVNSFFSAVKNAPKTIVPREFYSLEKYRRTKLIWWKHQIL